MIEIQNVFFKSKLLQDNGRTKNIKRSGVLSTEKTIFFFLFFTQIFRVAL